MKQNRLGQSELYVSEIGLGCMSLGTDKEKAVSLVHAAIDGGINFWIQLTCTMKDLMRRL